MADLQNHTQVSMTLIRSLVFYCDMLCIPRPELFTGLDLTSNALEDVDSNIPESVYDRLLANAVVASRDPHFGLRMGYSVLPPQLGVLGYLIMNSPTLHASLVAYEKYQASLGESLQIRIRTLGAKTRIKIHSFGGKLSGLHRLESFATSLRRCAYELTGKTLQFSRVVFEHEVKASTTYTSFMGIVPEKGNENIIEFSSQALSYPVVYSSPELISIFEDKLTKKMDMQRSDSIALKVQRYIDRAVHGNQPVTTTSIAQSLQLSVRVMQTKLAQEKTSFQSMLNKAKAGLAMHFIRSGSSTAEVAYALGFSEPAAFARSFKNWTGLTPKQARL